MKEIKKTLKTERT